MLMTETDAAAAWLMHEHSKTLKGLSDELKVRRSLRGLDSG